MSAEARIAAPMRCDFCLNTAVIDGKTTFGPWAYMCETHWEQYGVGQLGTGYGQRLVVAE